MEKNIFIKKRNNMELFIDTANIEEIKDAVKKGIISGVTTNPSLLSKEPKTDFYKHIEKIVTICKENGNCTCCFTATQLQLAAQAGASYVSLFYNRLLDNGGNPEEVLTKTRKFIDKNNLDCKIIAGSIRNTYDIDNCWHYGSDIVTASHKVIKNSTKHLKTKESVTGFLNDFKEWLA
jgi:transaldolase